MRSIITHIKEIINWQRIKSTNHKKIYDKWVTSGKAIPPPHAAKQEIIKYYRDKFKLKMMIETGTFRGEMVYAMRNVFETIISIELSPILFEKAKRKFEKYPHIRILQGDSGTVLKHIVPNLMSPALFWLDGHYSGFETAKGNHETPIWQELETIISSDHDHVILIDDARLFSGNNDYPRLDELQEFLLLQKKNYKFKVQDDIIVYHP